MPAALVEGPRAQAEALLGEAWVFTRGAAPSEPYTVTCDCATAQSANSETAMASTACRFITQDLSAN